MILLLVFVHPPHSVTLYYIRIANRAVKMEAAELVQSLCSFVQKIGQNGVIEEQGIDLLRKTETQVSERFKHV